MLKRSISVLVFSALICTPIIAAAQDYADERAEATRLGLLLHEFDSSAWVATDALREKTLAWKLYTETATPKGWVTTEVGDGRLMTAFVAELNGKTVSVFDVITKGRKVKKKLMYPMGRELTAGESLQLRAKATLPIDDIEPCPNLLPMNTIVIPTETPGELYVYLMSSTQKHNTAVMGRHYRFRMTEGGTKVAETVQFSNSCLALPTRAPNGADLVGILSSHVRTPYPQEHHVFASLSHKKTFFIVMPKTDTAWKIKGAKIKPFDMDKLKP